VAATIAAARTGRLHPFHVRDMQSVNNANRSKRSNPVKVTLAIVHRKRIRTHQTDRTDRIATAHMPSWQMRQDPEALWQMRQDPEALWQMRQDPEALWQMRQDLTPPWQTPRGSKCRATVASKRPTIAATGGWDIVVHASSRLGNRHMPPSKMLHRWLFRGL